MPRGTIPTEARRVHKRRQAPIPERAVSTGQAARCCFVTAETIVNWIRSHRLTAQRTAGGQYRIRLADLRAFMVDTGMSTRPLDDALDLRPYCWEFHDEAGSGPASTGGADCERCLVRRAGTLNCWELHGLLPLTARRVAQCDHCEYHGRHHDASGDSPEATEGLRAAERTDGGEG